MRMWDELEQRIAENERDGGPQLPLRRGLLEVLRKNHATPTHATKKMVAFSLGRDGRLLWGIEAPGTRFYLDASLHDRVSDAGFSTHSRQYQAGEKDGGRHSALSRDWSFRSADVIMTIIESVVDLERLLSVVVSAHGGKA